MKQDLKLDTNLSLEIEVLDGPYEGSYKSKIDSIDGDQIFIGIPLSKGVPIPLGVNTRVRITYMDPVAIYSFEGVIIDRVSNPRALFAVEYPKEIKRIQRRSFVRCDVRFPITFTKLSDSMEVIVAEQKGVVADISGGGLRVETETEIKVGEYLDIYFELPNKEKLSALGKVVRVIPQGDMKVLINNIGVCFEFIEERDRDKIMRYIFEKQRELRQKGLL